MKKLNALLFITLSLFAISCEESGELGLTVLNPDDLVGTKLIDSANIKTFTTLYNSDIYTDSTNVLLCGTYIDPVFGRISTKTFFQLLQGGESILGDSPICDSVKLELGIAFNAAQSPRVFGDTLVPASYFLYKITGDFGDRKYTPSENISVESNPFATLSDISIRPNTQKSLSFKFDKSFGDQLLSRWNNSAELQNLLKGFSLQTNDENAVVYAFNTGVDVTGLRIYYHNSTANNLVQNLYLTSGAKRFNQIISDRSGTIISELLTNGDYLPDSETNGTVFLQSGTGLGTVLSVPSLPSLLDSLKGATINKAEIILHMADGSYTGVATRPTRVNSLIEADTHYLPKKEAGKVVGVLIDKTFSTEVNPDYVNQTYTIALTSYFQQLILGNKKPTNLLLQPLENGAAVSRAIICGENYSNSDKKPKLRIYYTK